MAREVFRIGDTVARKYDGTRLTVSWVSKGAVCRDDQLIATEANSFSHPYSDASCFDLVAA